jgi:hypothetical protein
MPPRLSHPVSSGPCTMLTALARELARWREAAYAGGLRLAFGRATRLPFAAGPTAVPRAGRLACCRSTIRVW